MKRILIFAMPIFALTFSSGQAYAGFWDTIKNAAQSVQGATQTIQNAKDTSSGTGNQSSGSSTAETGSGDIYSDGSV